MSEAGIVIFALFIVFSVIVYLGGKINLSFMEKEAKKLRKSLYKDKHFLEENQKPYRQGWGEGRTEKFLTGDAAGSSSKLAASSPS